MRRTRRSTSLIVNRGLDRRHGARRGSRPRLRGAAREAHERAGAVRVAGIERAVVHPLHVGHHRQAEGRAARHRRLRGRARDVDARHLLRGAGRDDVHHQRHRLGGRALLHHLRAAPQRLDDHHVRGAADPARPGDLVEDRRRSQGQDDVQLAHGDPRAEEAGPGVHDASTTTRRSSTCSSPASRSTSRPRAGCPIRSAAWRSSTTTGRPSPAGRSCPRSSGVEETPRKFGSPSFPAAGYDVRLLHETTGEEVGADEKGVPDHRAAAAARMHVDRVGRRRALREDLLRHVPRPLRVLDVRLGDARCRRLLLRARPHRRRDQRRRPPARHARDRGSGAGAPGHRGGRGSRRRRSRSRARFRSRSPW